MEQHFRINDFGTVVMVEPLTDRAKTWVSQNVDVESWRRMGRAFACGPGAIDNLLWGFNDSLFMDECGGCGADIYADEPVRPYGPWHLLDDDCRAVRIPREAAKPRKEAKNEADFH